MNSYKVAWFGGRATDGRDLEGWCSPPWLEGCLSVPAVLAPGTVPATVRRIQQLQSGFQTTRDSKLTGHEVALFAVTRREGGASSMGVGSEWAATSS